MEGKINTEIIISKTEVLSVGTKIKIIDVCKELCGPMFRCIIPSGKSVLIEPIKIDIVGHTPFAKWTKTRRIFGDNAQKFLEDPEVIKVALDTENGKMEEFDARRIFIQACIEFHEWSITNLDEHTLEQ